MKEQQRQYQRGWVRIEGARGRKRYVGRYRTVDGKCPKVALGLVSEMTLSEARQKIEARVRQLGSRPMSALRVTFKEYWTQQYVPRRRVRWSEPTERGYEMYMKAYLFPAFGNVSLTDIDAEHIAAFFDKLRGDHARSVVLKVWTLLGAVFEDAVDADILLKNPQRLTKGWCHQF
jgi:hypothetical protein